jgi:Tol biopolymer transport system component
MKKLLILGLAVFLSFPSCLKQRAFDKNNLDYTQAVDSEQKVFLYRSERIVYGRFGDLKGIFIASSKGLDRVFENQYEKASGFKNKVVFFGKCDNEEGIYLADLNNKTYESILKNYYLDSRPSFSADGDSIVFLAHTKIRYKRPDGSYDIFDSKTEPYYMTLKDKSVKKLNISEDIRDISFLNNDNLIYSKKVQQGEESFYQIFGYDLENSREYRLITSNSNDLNSVVSNDRRKIAFLSDKNNKYNLYIYDLQDKSIKKIDMKDAIVGGTVKWSPDDRYIVCVTLNGGSKDKIKIADLQDETIEEIGKGYIVDYSLDGKYLIYAAFNDGEDEKSQIIFKRKIGEDYVKQIMRFPEKGKYSKSINLLYSIGL